MGLRKIISGLTCDRFLRTLGEGGGLDVGRRLRALARRFRTPSLNSSIPFDMNEIIESALDACREASVECDLQIINSRSI